MLPWCILHLFLPQDAQVLADNTAGMFWFNDVIDKSTLSRDQWVRESCCVLRCIFLDVLIQDELRHVSRDVRLKRERRRRYLHVPITSSANTYLSMEDNLYGTLRSHNGDFSTWPCIVGISAQMLT